MKKLIYTTTALVLSIAAVSCKSSNSVSAEAVDLGLSVKWASMNIGAQEEHQAGMYLAWGETSEKNDYAIEGEYKYGRYQESLSPDYGMTKYNTSDSLTVLTAEDDPASTLWGDGWRTPTVKEFEELLDEDKCEWEWVVLKKRGTIGRACGYKVTSKVPGFEGNSIFLPATGYRFHCDSRSELKHVGNSGNYWTSTCSSVYPFSACAAYFTDEEQRWDYALRCFGRCVRPVKD